jgi:hypothetical protein
MSNEIFSYRSIHKPQKWTYYTLVTLQTCLARLFFYHRLVFWAFLYLLHLLCRLEFKYQKVEFPWSSSKQICIVKLNKQFQPRFYSIPPCLLTYGKLLHASELSCCSGYKLFWKGFIVEKQLWYHKPILRIELDTYNTLFL